MKGGNDRVKETRSTKKDSPFDLNLLSSFLNYITFYNMEDKSKFKNSKSCKNVSEVTSFLQN